MFCITGNSSLQQCMTLPSEGRKVLNWDISSNPNQGTQPCMLLKSPVDAGTTVFSTSNFTIKIIMWLIYGEREILLRLHQIKKQILLGQCSETKHFFCSVSWTCCCIPILAWIISTNSKCGVVITIKWTTYKEPNQEYLQCCSVCATDIKDLCSVELGSHDP